MRHRFAAVVALAVAVAACGGGSSRVVVAAGPDAAGVVDVLADSYEQTHTGARVSIVGRSTREVLELGRQGAADLLITHAPEQERAFLAVYPEAVAFPLFSSRFLLVGPPHLVGELAGMTGAAAFAAIGAAEHPFVSRADGSGTFEREQALWSSAGIDPASEPWYSTTGQGMGLSLQVADQTGAFILVEEGSFHASEGVLSLIAVRLDPGIGELDNPYTAIVPERNPAAEAFVSWMLSSEGRDALVSINQDAFGAQVFAP